MPVRACVDECARACVDECARSNACLSGISARNRLPCDVNSQSYLVGYSTLLLNSLMIYMRVCVCVCEREIERGGDSNPNPTLSPLEASTLARTTKDTGLPVHVRPRLQH